MPLNVCSLHMFSRQPCLKFAAQKAIVCCCQWHVYQCYKFGEYHSVLSGCVCCDSLWPSSSGAAGFLEVDKALGSSRIDCEFSGSTSVVSFLKGKTLTTAWVGDSRGVLGRSKKGGGYEAVPLTKDHKPTAPEEKARIVATNGRVERSASTHTLGRTYPSALALPCSWVTMAGQCDKVVCCALPVVRCFWGLQRYQKPLISCAGLCPV